MDLAYVIIILISGSANKYIVIHIRQDTLIMCHLQYIIIYSQMYTLPTLSIFLLYLIYIAIA
jgi:hypothetical protein